MTSILIGIILVSATPSFEVQTLDGRTLSGQLLELKANRLTLALHEGKVSLDARDVLTLVPMQRPKPALRATDVVVEMIDGSVVRGQKYISRGSLSRITLSGGETIEVPASVVRTVRFQEDFGEIGSEWSRLIELNVDSDLLIVRSDDALDYHKGVLQDVTEDVVRFELDGESLPVKRSKVFGFVYRRGKTPELPPAICRVTDSTGSQWSARSLALAEELQWTTPAGLSLSQPLSNIALINFSGGRLAYLSDLRPDSSVWTPYFGALNPSPSARRFHAPRLDRGFESPVLQLGGEVYGKGLALYCRTELIYRLPGRFSRFLSVAGIDDAVRPNGKVRLTIRGDDKVLLETVISGSEPPQAINLDVQDVRRLTILVDFADGFGAGDRMLMCNARIVK